MSAPAGRARRVLAATAVAVAGTLAVGMAVAAPSSADAAPTLGQLAASIAHEVNQPLSAIITYAKSGKRWLLREVPDPIEVADCLDHIAANGTRAAEVIARIRDLARPADPKAGRIALPALVGYWPEMMSATVAGRINLAYLFALSQFVMAWALMAAYVRRARQFDRTAAALIAQPGQLRTSLLGMSFLNRLESWEVRGDKLIMRGYP